MPSCTKHGVKQSWVHHSAGVRMALYKQSMTGEQRQSRVNPLALDTSKGGHGAEGGKKPSATNYITRVCHAIIVVAIQLKHMPLLLAQIMFFFFFCFAGIVGDSEKEQQCFFVLSFFCGGFFSMLLDDNVVNAHLTAGRRREKILQESVRSGLNQDT